MPKVIEAMGWNSYDSVNDRQLPLEWRVVVRESYDNPEWIVIKPIRVVKSTVESVGEFKFWREEVRSGLIKISDQDYQRILAAQIANDYHGPYCVAQSA